MQQPQPKGSHVMPHERTEQVAYRIPPNTPVAITLPPVEARPDHPLPDAGPFLRVFAGTDEPGTVLLRCAREYLGNWRHVYEHGRNREAAVDEHVSLLTFLIDREANGHTRAISFEPGAPTNPSSYGEMVAWLAWKYLLVSLRHNQSAHAEYDAAQLVSHIEAFDQLVVDVQAGRVRLPEKATGVFPPKTIRPSSAQTDTPDPGSDQAAQ
ncbi:hypothetical protein ACQPXH_23965 [Nocardia sp. CA-135953]|uniref:hypothetical protein n=1 Tax=Nocardia sp. CA-135953 TaxID=3239978 RepID=UPI003D981A5D